MSDTVHLPSNGEDERSWQGDFDPFSDPEERRVLFAAFDSFRWVNFEKSSLFKLFFSWLMNLLGGNYRDHAKHRTGSIGAPPI